MSRNTPKSRPTNRSRVINQPQGGNQSIIARIQEACGNGVLVIADMYIDICKVAGTIPMQTCQSIPFSNTMSPSCNVNMNRSEPWNLHVRYLSGADWKPHLQYFHCKSEAITLCLLDSEFLNAPPVCTTCNETLLHVLVFFSVEALVQAL